LPIQLVQQPTRHGSTPYVHLLTGASSTAASRPTPPDRPSGRGGESATRCYPNTSIRITAKAATAAPPPTAERQQPPPGREPAPDERRRPTEREREDNRREPPRHDPSAASRDAATREHGVPPRRPMRRPPFIRNASGKRIFRNSRGHHRYDRRWMIRRHLMNIREHSHTLFDI